MIDGSKRNKNNLNSRASRYISKIIVINTVHDKKYFTGQKFASLEEKTLISGVLRKFKVEAAERREDVRISAELIIRAKDGLHISIYPRTR